MIFSLGALRPIRNLVRLKLFLVELTPQMTREKLHYSLLLAEFYYRVAAARHVRAEHGHELVGFSGHEQCIAELKRMLSVDVVIGKSVNE